MLYISMENFEKLIEGNFTAGFLLFCLDCVARLRAGGNRCMTIGRDYNLSSKGRQSCGGDCRSYC
jgi:hypothetical protein